MKVLVLEQASKERATILQAIQTARHEPLVAETAEQAWQWIQARQARFVIADAEYSDIVASQLVRRVRAAGIPPVYFLLLTAHEKAPSDGDDLLHKPFKLIDLQTRLTIGQRILSMGDSLSQARDQLENTAMYDPLTGMMNQTAFNKFAQSELERARRASSSLSLIALEIDNFQWLSDRYGVDTADKLLKLVAENIRERSRSYDCVGRWTGPEFMIALLNVTGPDAETIARRLVTSIRFMNTSQVGLALDVNISAGVSSASNITEATGLELLVEQARLALARAKQTGGYQVVLAPI